MPIAGGVLDYGLDWNVWDRARPRCYRLYRDWETFALYAIDRWSITKLRRTH
jgi:hypothetical protein